MIDAIARFISDAGWLAPLYYVLSFVVSALLPFIPTPLIGALGGTAFGFVPAVIYGVMGMGLGAITALGLARLIGRPVVLKLVRPSTWEQWEGLLGIRSVLVWGVIFFVLNLDFAVVIAGLTTLPVRQLWLAAMIARLPWLIGSAWFGDTVLVSDSVLIVILILMIPAVFMLQKLRPHVRRLLLRFEVRTDAPHNDKP